MAVLSLTDAYVEVNAVDYSSHADSVEVSFSVDELEDTAFGDTYRSRIGGLKDVSITVNWHQDFSSSIDAAFFPLLGTVVAVEVRPTSGAASATNPSYAGNVLISQYSPLANGVGELATLSTTWPGSGTWTRSTS